ncbi:MAG TPA: hypothetical protein PK629_06965 [Oscillospiraceae bacterium]|nr:hypothetical protein [Oscillospiraceae bacterium]HPF55277.1 hypothetical protein [Clostridiales bacterium]HPK34681.1 hypothetical protein [Oscillospiraceae bacterium]HPR74555.1 hypothetical protein [Oscillospiraceae bacterium]
MNSKSSNIFAVGRKENGIAFLAAALLIFGMLGGLSGCFVGSHESSEETSVEEVSSAVSLQGNVNIADFQRSGTASVCFYDGQMNEITADALWYDLTTMAVLRVQIDGDLPDLIAVYITPAGTETADQRQQVAVIAPTGDGSSVDIALNANEIPVSYGHLEVSLKYGDVAYFSDLYNVFYEAE